MRLIFDVEEAGWGRLRLVDQQITLDLKVSYLSDVLTKLIDAFVKVAEGAEAAEAGLGLEPGDAWLRIQRRGRTWSTIELRVEDHGVVMGTTAFRVETRKLARIALNMAESVDRETYLDEWSPKATWPSEGLLRLQHVDHGD